MTIPYQKSLVWLRRDLRPLDNHAIFQALKNSKEVHFCFVLDKTIIQKLDDSFKDKRLSFIKSSITEMEDILGQKIDILYGDPSEEIPQFLKAHDMDALYYNKDYEPYAKKRDAKVHGLCKKLNIDIIGLKDQVVFEYPEIVKGDGGTYSVFTPYKNAWMRKLEEQEGQIPLYRYTLKSLKSKLHCLNTRAKEFDKIPDSTLPCGPKAAEKTFNQFLKVIDAYHVNRDYPSIKGTSSLSPYIRFGIISPRRLAYIAYQKENSNGASTWLSELIWREFYQMVLDTHPNSATSELKANYKNFPWEKNQKHFKMWCEGKTGIPIVDAAMRCLNETGEMHNRLRMVVANYFCRILLLDWRKGERYFASKLLDFDLASNVGGWQWSSGSGNDAAPYFRIFNPYTQGQKFDKDGAFIKKWCPELEKFSSKYIHRPDSAPEDLQEKWGCIIGKDYSRELVAYDLQRVKSLNYFKKILS
tara:strand:- start:83647 stop:85059 length:1413 start_codon:yes stop_codon:yes gene_type:complete